MEFEKEIFSFIGSLPVNKITGDVTFFEAMKTAECQLTLDTLTVTKDENPSDILFVDNYSTSEIRIHDFWHGKFINQVYEGHKKGKLK